MTASALKLAGLTIFWSGRATIWEER